MKGVDAFLVPPNMYQLSRVKSNFHEIFKERSAIEYLQNHVNDLRPCGTHVYSGK